MKSRRSSSPWNVIPRREATRSTTPLRGRRSSFSSPAAGVQTRTRKVCMRSWCGAGLSAALAALKAPLSVAGVGRLADGCRRGLDPSSSIFWP